MRPQKLHLGQSRITRLIFEFSPKTHFMRGTPLKVLSTLNLDFQTDLTNADKTLIFAESFVLFLCISSIISRSSSGDKYDNFAALALSTSISSLKGLFK